MEATLKDRGALDIYEEKNSGKSNNPAYNKRTMYALIETAETKPRTRVEREDSFRAENSRHSSSTRRPDTSNGNRIRFPGAPGSNSVFDTNGNHVGDNRDHDHNDEDGDED